MSLRSISIIGLCFVSALACGACRDADTPDKTANDGGVVLETFPVHGSLGISGLARSDDGTLWALPERDRRMIVIPPSGPITRVAIHGAPEGVDLESLAWIGGATLAFGTESQKADRLTDPIYFGVVGEAGIELKPKLLFDYGAFSTRATRNAGIEALCAAGSKLVAVSEMVLEVGGRRVAPMMVYDLKTGAAQRNTLLLLSEVGKIAGLSCRTMAGSDALEALAIERHFGISMVLRFIIPVGEKDQTLPSEMIFDFGARLTPPPNFEGIEWISEDEALLVSDNQFRTQTGETQLVKVKVPLHNHPAR